MDKQLQTTKMLQKLNNIPVECFDIEDGELIG